LSRWGQPEVHVKSLPQDENASHEFERLADQRELAAARDEAGLKRERAVQAVMAFAVEGDRLAEARDRAAESRDSAAEARAVEDGTSDGPAALARGQAAVDRLLSGRDRDHAAGHRADLAASWRQAERDLIADQR
jgi:hypothetical protein